MLNQPIIYSITVAWENRRNFPTPPLHGFPAKRRLRNKRRNSILMMPHHPDVGSASDCLREISLTTRPIRSTTQIWVVTRHQCGISAVVSQTLRVSRINQCSAVVVKYRLFSQASVKVLLLWFLLFPYMTHVCIFQGVRFDPDASLTLRLEFARSNTKVSKPVNKQAVLAPHFFPREPQFSKSIQNSFIHSLYFMKWNKILSFIHSFIHSFARSFVRSFINILFLWYFLSYVLVPADFAAAGFFPTPPEPSLAYPA